MCCQMFNYAADAIIRINSYWNDKTVRTASEQSYRLQKWLQQKQQANIGQGYRWGDKLRVYIMEFDQFECILVWPDNKMTKRTIHILCVCACPLMSSEMRHDVADVDARCFILALCVSVNVSSEIHLNLHVTTLNVYVRRFKTTICLLSASLLYSNLPVDDSRKKI